jgi:hypothetical protein
MLEINFVKIKNIILMYFQTENTLKKTSIIIANTTVLFCIAIQPQSGKFLHCFSFKLVFI